MATQRSNLVFIGAKGTVVALDRSTGTELWRTGLKGNDFVNLVVDGDDLFASTKGELFCLDPTTGQIRWNNALKGLGWGLVTIGMPPGGQTAAMAEKRRREQQAATAAAASAGA